MNCLSTHCKQLQARQLRRSSLCLHKQKLKKLDRKRVLGIIYIYICMYIYIFLHIRFMRMLIYKNKWILSKYNKLVKSYLHLLTLHFLALKRNTSKQGFWCNSHHSVIFLNCLHQTSHHQHCCNGGWCPGHGPWPCDHTTSTSWCNEMYL